MNFYIILLFSLAFILIGFAVFLCKRRNIPGVKPFIACVLLVAIWNITYAADLLNHSLEGKAAWFSIRMAFIVYIPALWLMVTLELTDHQNFKDWRNIPLCIIPTITAILVLTFYCNSWFIYNFHLQYTDGYKILRFDTGPWFWISATYNYLLHTINIGLLLQAVFSKQYARRKQAITIIIGMFIPIVSDIMLVANIGPNKYLDFTSISFFFTLFVSAFAMFKYGFMNIVPIAREYAFEDMDELMIVLDENKKVVDMNKKALKMFNSTIQKIIGTPIDQIIQDIETYNFCDSHSSSLKIRLNHKFAGEKIYYYGSVSAIRKNRGNVIGYLLLLQDITELTNTQYELKQLNKELRELNKELYNETIKDGLTAVYNKSYITMLLREAVEKSIQDKTPLTIALFDIDLFKKVNDNYGHLIGDKVLKKVAELINTELGTKGKLGRFGGEEFLVLMMNTDLKAGGKICEKIRYKISNYKFEHEQLTITISAGVSELKLSDNISSLIKRADECLYRAKTGGRNKVELSE